jgi:hypothetical protein
MVFFSSELDAHLAWGNLINFIIAVSLKKILIAPFSSSAPAAKSSINVFCILAAQRRGTSACVYPRVPLVSLRAETDYR